MQIFSQTAHQRGHGCELESFAAHQLSEDVDGVKVLSVHSVLLKLGHVLPVLQRQADLHRGQKRKFTKCVTEPLNPGRQVCAAVQTCSEGEVVWLWYRLYSR